MSTLIFNYGNWTYWELYSPPSYFGNQKVTFDGPNKLILVNYEETEIDVKQDIYSNWKEWFTIEDNSKYLSALTAIGGDPITASTFVGTTYFLENGWRLKPWQGDYVLTVLGNLYTREIGGNPVVPTSGVSVSFTRSNLVDFISPATVIDDVNTKIDSNVIPVINSARDHARAANIQTQTI